MEKKDNDSDMKEEEHLLLLKMLFPKRCPEWLQSLVEKMMTELEHIGDSDERKASLEKMLWMKIEELLSLPLGESDSLPSINDWKEKNKKEEEIKLISNYNVEDFIRIYGDPLADADLGTNWRVPESEFPLYRDHSIEFLKQKFPRHSVTTIKEAFDEYGNFGNHENLLFSYADLKHLFAPTRKTSRSGTDVRVPDSQSLSFLKEKRYLELEPEMERLEDERDEEVASADKLVTCTCCLSSAELLPKELVTCPAGHGYCKECVVRSAQEVPVVGGRRGVVECLETGCHEGFAPDDLEKILPAKVLSTLKQLQQREEILASGLLNLVFCPFCPYMVIMEDPSDKVVKCMNPECSKDSCRTCHSPNHCEEAAEGAQREKITNFDI
jgi:TRIAD3 protein (E3 ubiquitin-protein ligase RNF216)